MPVIFLLILVFGLGTHPLYSQTIHLAYTANLNCNLEACHCENNDLGGMVQLRAVVDSLRESYPGLILLDSGDFLNTYTLKEADSLMWELMHDLRYNAIAPGDQEFVEGIRFIKQQEEKFPLPFISSNIFDKESNRLLYPPVYEVEKSGIRIVVIGVTEPVSFEFIEEPAIRVLPVKEQIRKQVNRWKGKADLFVLLYHADFRRAEALAAEFPQIAVIISGHSQEKVEIARGRQIILQPGVDGEYLGLLEISRVGQKFRFKNRFIPVNSEYGVNRLFESKVKAYYEMMNREPE